MITNDKDYEPLDRIVGMKTNTYGTIIKLLKKNTVKKESSIYLVRWDNGAQTEESTGWLCRLIPNIKRYGEIQPLTKEGGYEINVHWRFLGKALQDWFDNYGLEIEPDFQRSHVWTTEKRIAFVEYRMRGGKLSRTLYFNCPAFGRGGKEKMVLVDGLQRLTAVRMFLDDKLPAFGQTFKQYTEEDQRTIGMQCDFIFNVNDLPTRKQILELYIDLNTGGVAHTSEEIERVRELLKKENENLKT
jgi:hypothetical protein